MRNFKNKPYVMYTFLIIQSVIFLLMQLTPIGGENGATIVQFGGQSSPLIILDHEYWRFITPIFVHIGLNHFVLNSVTLYFLGEQMEDFYGHFRFFILYLVSGIAGNVLSFAMQNINSVSAGASTSLFGLFGGFIILRRYLPSDPKIITITKLYLFLVVFNLFFNIFMPSIDIWGHLGGFIGGILLGIILAIPKRIRKYPYPMWERISSGVLLFAFFVFFLVLGFMKVRLS